MSGLFKKNLYRVHDYRNLNSYEIFESLSKELYTNEGKLWMGLTKHMSLIEKNNYDKQKHKIEFQKEIQDSKEFIDAIKAYIKSFYTSYNYPAEASYYTWFSNNILLNHSEYKNFSDKVKVIHMTYTISRWLTVISQFRTWDCENACKFWIVNNLYAKYYILHANIDPPFHTTPLL